MVQARFLKKYLLLGFPLTGLFLGNLVDQYETNRMIRFRDKSALYGRNLAPGEQPSWPNKFF